MAGKFRMRWHGLDAFKRTLKTIKQRMPASVGAALFVEGEKTMGQAKRITPVDEGVLRSSGHVQLPEFEGTHVEVEIGFGGPAGTGTQGPTNERAVGYALTVHENLQAFHRVGQAKYLEQPFNERRDGLGQRLARTIRRRLVG